MFSLRALRYKKGSDARPTALAPLRLYVTHRAVRPCEKIIKWGARSPRGPSLEKHTSEEKHPPRAIQYATTGRATVSTVIGVFHGGDHGGRLTA